MGNGTRYKRNEKYHERKHFDIYKVMKHDLKQELMNDVVAMINYKPIEQVTSQVEYELKMLEAQQLQLKLLLEIVKKLQASGE